MTDGPGGMARLVAAIEPFDEVERSDQADALAWLDRSQTSTAGSSPRRRPGTWCPTSS